MTATVAVALPHGSTASLTPFAPNGWAATGTAAAVLVWGFAGWEAVASLAGDYRDPRRDVPRATGIAVVVVGVLYLGLAPRACSCSGPATGRSQAPLSDLMAIAPGRAGPGRHRRRRGAAHARRDERVLRRRVAARRRAGPRRGPAADGWPGAARPVRCRAAARCSSRPARCSRSSSPSCWAWGSRRSCCSRPAASRSSTSSARLRRCASSRAAAWPGGRPWSPSFGRRAAGRQRGARPVGPRAGRPLARLPVRCPRMGRRPSAGP